MIFVSLGTQDKPFYRILEKLENSRVDEEIIVQAGFTKFESKRMKIYEYVGPEDFNRYISEASIIISHGGVGTIMKALDLNKVVIACPRLAKYKEHQNDHQKQIVDNFASAGYILSFNEDDDVDEIIAEARSFKPKHFKSNQTIFLDKLANYLESI